MSTYHLLMMRFETTVGIIGDKLRQRGLRKTIGKPFEHYMPVLTPVDTSVSLHTVSRSSRPQPTHSYILISIPRDRLTVPLSRISLPH
jgi:hypothetical protein